MLTSQLKCRDVTLWYHYICNQNDAEKKDYNIENKIVYKSWNDFSPYQESCTSDDKNHSMIYHCVNAAHHYYWYHNWYQMGTANIIAAKSHHNGHIWKCKPMIMHWCYCASHHHCWHHNYANPVYGVATICHQVRWLRWGHPSLFHTATSLLMWYKMFCMRDISYRLIWMEFINMFSVYAQSGRHSRFDW